MIRPSIQISVPIDDLVEYVSDLDQDDFTEFITLLLDASTYLDGTPTTKLINALEGLPKDTIKRLGWTLAIMEKYP